MKDFLKRIGQALRNEVVFLTVIGIVALALDYTEVVAIPDQWIVYVELITAVLASAGVFVNPTTAGVTDDERTLVKEFLDLLAIIAKMIGKKDKDEVIDDPVDDTPVDPVPDDNDDDDVKKKTIDISGGK